MTKPQRVEASKFVHGMVDPWLFWCSHCCYRFYFRAILRPPASVEARLDRHRGLIAPQKASSLTFIITFRNPCVRGFFLYYAPVNKKPLYCPPKITDSDRITLDYCERCARSTRLCGKVEKWYSFMTLHACRAFLQAWWRKETRSIIKTKNPDISCLDTHHIPSRRFHT
jgi:hypothetical protein